MEQEKTPLLDAIVEYTTDRPVYFKIPGHRYEKGISPRWRQWTGDGIFRFDLTEAEGLDDLHEPEGVIREAQELAAEVFRAKKTYFLVNGTTCGNEAMVLASVKEGEKIMVARNAHKSVLMGLTMSGAVPVYLMPKQDPVTGLWGSLTPETVEEGFRQHPECKAVFLVSPTYYGVCSDIRKIADICHKYGALLLVDEAHGGHLYFQKEGTPTETLPQGAILQGADLCAQSMHKVTGSLTQSSLLHVGSDRVDLGRLEACLHMVQSTSPSYLLMTSLDAARYELALHGAEMLERGLHLAQTAREAIRKIPGITCVGTEEKGDAIFDLDTVRLVISASGLGLSGYQLADRLYEEYKIGMELADDRYVVAVVTYANDENDMKQLVDALQEISRIERKNLSGKVYQQAKEKQPQSQPTKDQPTEHQDFIGTTRPVPQIPPMLDTPRQAFFGEKKRIPWKEARGKIAAEALIPYPPGIPLVNPGEQVTDEIWEYMEEYRKKGLHFHGPSDAALNSFCILERD